MDILSFEIEFFRFWDELPKITIQHQNRSNLVHAEIHLDDTVRIVVMTHKR